MGNMYLMCGHVASGKSWFARRFAEKNGFRYLDIDGHYVVYHTQGGDLKEYATLKEACGKIQRSFFVFANRLDAFFGIFPEFCSRPPHNQNGCEQNTEK